MSSLPTLNRQDSDTSQWTDAEKDGVKHLDQSRVPQTIAEEDEGGNVGLAAYERSKEQGEIVRAWCRNQLNTDKPDARAEQENQAKNRHALATPFPHHPNPPVPRQDCPELRQGFRNGKGHGYVW